MTDFDVVIVGGGPAGLTAGAQLARAGHRALVLERDLFGGALQHTDRIDDYAAFPHGITGANLAAHLIDEANAAGATLEQAEVSAIELFSRSRWVACSDGRGFSCNAVILAGGTHYIKLGDANEERLRGRGVVDCTPCDGGFFVGKPVVIYGSSDYAHRDARYLQELGCNVTLLAPDRVRLDSIVGSDRVEAVECTDLTSTAKTTLPAAGVLIRLGIEPASKWLAELIDLEPDGRVAADAEFGTSAPLVLACGDIRAGGRGTVAGAVEDGVAAAARASELLKQAVMYGQR
jgi:thioredoxin reductase (NADPH)